MRMQPKNPESMHSAGPVQRWSRATVLLPWLLLLVAGCGAALAQQPVSTAPLFQANAQYVQGRTWADYRPTAGTGLTLNLAAGTVWCKDTLVTYAGGTLTMTDAATNYVYLNPAANCVPVSTTAGFRSIGIPLATVTTASGVITSVTDTRSFLSATPSTATVNVQDYGAVCDDTTDATPSIQAALNAVNSTRGGIVFFPAVGCTGAYKFSALTMPATPHGWITFLSDADWTITHEIDWLNSDTAIIGRSGSEPASFQELPGFRINNGASLTNAFNINAAPAYYTGILLENIQIAGFANGIDYRRVMGMTLRNVNVSVATGSSLIARDSFILEIDRGVYRGAQDGSTPAIIFEGVKADSFSSMHLHDFTLINSGIYMYSSVTDLPWNQWILFDINNVLQESAQGTYAPFLTIGDALYIAGLSIRNSQMADVIGGAMWTAGVPLINMAGTSYLKDAEVSNVYNGSGPVFQDTAALNRVIGARISGYVSNGSYQNDTGLTRYYLLTGPSGQLGSTEPAWFGEGADAGLGNYWNSQLTLAPPERRTALRMKMYDSHYSDALRVESASGSNLFAVASDGILNGPKMKGSLQLAQLASPGTPTVTPTGGSATSWGYKITAYDVLGNSTAASSEGTTVAGAATLSSSAYNTITWAVSPNCSYYKVNRTTAGGTPATTGNIAIVPCLRENPNHNTMTYVDNGVAILDAGMPPTTNTTGKASIPTLNLTNPLELAYGGTAATSWTAARCVRVNDAGTALEAASGDCTTGSGLTSLNGLTGSSQTFATPGTTGTSPNWVSSGTAHTLHLPMAATSSVTAGLISKTEYDTFNGKAATGTCTNQFIRGLSSSAPTCASVSMTADVTGITPSANGGTNSAYFGVASGLTGARTYTFPDANATIEYQANKAAASGYASLDANTRVPNAQMAIPAAAARGGVYSISCSSGYHISAISDTDGSVTCSADAGSTPRLDQVLDPTADKTFDLGTYSVNFRKNVDWADILGLHSIVDGASKEGQAQLGFGLYNNSATPKVKSIFSLLAYGKHADDGSLSDGVFAFYNPATDASPIRIDLATDLVSFEGPISLSVAPGYKSGTLTHNNTADRTYTLPDADGTLLSTASGSYVKAIVTGFCTGTAPANTAIGLFGLGRTDVTCGAYSAAGTRFVAPSSGTLKNFYVTEGTTQKSGTTIAWTVYKNGSSTSLTCTVSSGGTACNDTAHSVSVAAGDLITVTSGTTASSGETLANVSVSVELWN